LWTFKRFSEIGAKAHGLPGHQHLARLQVPPQDVISGTQDWVYEHLGALFWVVEVWSPNKEAGITTTSGSTGFRDHPVETI